MSAERALATQARVPSFKDGYSRQAGGEKGNTWQTACQCFASPELRRFCGHITLPPHAPRRMLPATIANRATWSLSACGPFRISIAHRPRPYASKYAWYCQVLCSIKLDTPITASVEVRVADPLLSADDAPNISVTPSPGDSAEDLGLLAKLPLARRGRCGAHWCELGCHKRHFDCPTARARKPRARDGADGP
jgi:hypothetical protein